MIAMGHQRMKDRNRTRLANRRGIESSYPRSGHCNTCIEP